MLRLIAATGLGALLLATPATALELNDCRIALSPSAQGVNARCATMPRPLDPDNPDAGSIELRVVLVPALNLDPLPDPVVPIAGGPGQGSVSFYAGYRFAFEGLRRDRHILLVDQRGTGQSTPLTCDIDDEVLDGQLSLDATREQTARCLEQLDADPRFFTTSVAVRDLEAVREALGFPALNLYGVSYGTRVAQHYARRYPETTRSVVLDAVVPPNLPLGPDIAIQSQRAVDDLFDRCAENAACSEAFPDLAENFRRVLAQVDEAPVDVTRPHPVSGTPETVSINRDAVNVAVRLFLYAPDSMALLPLMIEAAADGNFLPLSAAFSQSADSLGESLAIGMHNAVMCTEDVPFYDEIEIDNAAIDASYLSTMQLNALETMCSVWPEGVMDDNLRDLLDGDTPVLLLSGSADPITPPDYAEDAMAAMQNAEHHIQPGQGHGLLAVGCMPDLIAEFVTTADPGALDFACMDRAFLMPFFIDFSGPAP